MAQALPSAKIFSSGLMKPGVTGGIMFANMGMLLEVRPQFRVSFRSGGRKYHYSHGDRWLSWC